MIDTLELSPCTNEETADLIAHLRRDTGMGPGLALRLGGTVQVCRGTVVGWKAIGELRTAFTNLAGVVYPGPESEGTFRVCEVLDALRHPVISREQQPKDDLGTILRMIETIAAGMHWTPRVTLSDGPAGLYIADGNKTATAHYAYARDQKREDWRLPVYLPIQLTGPDGRPLS